MARLERKLLYDSLLVGAGITLLVILCDLAGLLTPLENWLYDRRARWCQFFLRPPTEQIVTVEVDNGAMDVLGEFPWPRATWARMIEELSAAGAKVVELDISLGRIARGKDDPAGAARADAEDAALAAAVRAAGNVIIPVSLKPQQEPSRLYTAMVDAFAADPEQDEVQLAQSLSSRKVAFDDASLRQKFIAARHEAIFRRLSNALEKNDLRPEQATHLVLKSPETSPLRDVVEQEYRIAAVAKAVRRFGIPPPQGYPRPTSTDLEVFGIAGLYDGAIGTAAVDYPSMDDGAVRSVPLFIEHDGRLYPHMGLALACAMTGADLHAMRFDREFVIIPRASGGDLRIHIRAPEADRNGNRFTTVIDVPWFGGHSWETMYDPAHRENRQQCSILKVYDIVDTRRRIEANLDQADTAMRPLVEASGVAKSRQRDSASRRPGDIGPEWMTLPRAVLDNAAPIGEPLLSAKRERELDHDEQAYLSAYLALKRVVDTDGALRQQLEGQRQALQGLVGGKAVLIGWVASAAVADFVRTPLHDKCPGVVVHGAVFNGLMTGELWRRAPVWVAAVITLVLGMMTAFITGYFSAVRALAIALVLAAAYALLNGIVLFDYGDRIVGAAGPLVAVGLVWAGCGVTRAIVETAERNRITRRFQSYVDPELVNYVLEHPEDARLEGQSREMTVVFTDLAGFTAISEQLKEKVVPILNEFLGRMVPIIRRHRGYVNKFLGDGIMFFMGAPAQNPSHASHAVAAICEMQKEVATFSREMESRGLPAVKMRAGVATGHMVVGDAGSADASDYTVLGDTVNFAARLQSANKATDTLTLVSARTAELLGDRFLLRPVGKLRVVGKTEGMCAFEVIGPIDAATDRDRRCVDVTRAMVESFLAARFSDSLAHAGSLESEFGRSELTEMYRELSQQYLQTPPANGFDGTIVLTEK
jgi:class 3 adenylate cyclase/CHASE2 domain-containing sensor protein